MDADDLTAALAGTPKPGRDDVLGSFQRKHRRKKTERRLLWASGATACAVAATVVVSMVQPWSKGPVVTDPACGTAHMTQTFAQAKNAGASILIADAVPAAQNGASGYTAVLLRSVQTLSGPAIAPGTIAWSHEKAAGISGKFFAVVWPKRAGTVGPIIRTAPVVGDNVIFSSYGCQDAASVPTPTSSGQSLGSPNGSLEGAFAISLRTVEAAAAGSIGDSQGNQNQPGSSTPGDSSAPRNGDSGNHGAGNNQGGNSQGNENSPSASPGQGNGGNSGNSQGNGYATPSASSGQGNGNGQGKGKGAKSGANNGNGQQ